MINAEKWRDAVRTVEDEIQLDEKPESARLAYESRAYSRYKGALTAYTNTQSAGNEKRLVTCTREYISLLKLIAAQIKSPAQWAAEERLKALCGGYEEGRI